MRPGEVKCLRRFRTHGFRLRKRSPFAFRHAEHQRKLRAFPWPERQVCARAKPGLNGCGYGLGYSHRRFHRVGVCFVPPEIRKPVRRIAHPGRPCKARIRPAGGPPPALKQQRPIYELRIHRELHKCRVRKVLRLCCKGDLREHAELQFPRRIPIIFQ